VRSLQAWERRILQSLKAYIIAGRPPAIMAVAADLQGHRGETKKQTIRAERLAACFEK